MFHYWRSSNFWRSLDIPLINCKVHLELNLIEDCILSSAGDSSKFEITDAKLHVLIVPLSTKDSVDLTKQLNERFKRSFYWNSYQTKPAKVTEKGKNLLQITSCIISRRWKIICSCLCCCCRCCKRWSRHKKQ